MKSIADQLSQTQNESSAMISNISENEGQKNLVAVTNHFREHAKCYRSKISDDRIRNAAETFGHIPEQTIRDALCDLSRNAGDFFPSNSDFHELFKPHLQHTAIRGYTCGKCKGIGLVGFSHKVGEKLPREKPSFYLFRCTCRNGDAYKTHAELPADAFNQFEGRF